MWQSGSRFEGYFKDNAIHGKGVFDFANGSKYQVASKYISQVERKREKEKEKPEKATGIRTQARPRSRQPLERIRRFCFVAATALPHSLGRI